jgi:Galactose oxidase, central domain/Kelch motif
MRFRSRTPPRSNPVRVLLGTFLILTVSAATDAMAAGTWSTTGSMTAARSTTATLLTDGRVLAAGGCGAFDIFDDCLTVLASAELYNPATGTWSATGSMSVARWFHTATRLLDGRVLVAGGFDSAFANLTSAELYDPATGTWSPTGSTSVGRFGFIATLLLDGRVLVAGGGANGTSAELYDPTTGAWSPTGSTSMCCPSTATLLRDGRVLVTGVGANVTSAELFDPTTGTWSPTGRPSGCCFHTATLLLTGQVLIAGGGVNGTSAALYDPTTGTWSPTGNLSFGACCAPATLLTDGRVLVVGGANGTGAQLFDPTTGTWSPTGSTSACCFSTATLLLDGRVLVTGGFPNGTAAELFNSSPLLAAVLPSSRSVQVGTPAIAFATIINTGTSRATGCQIAPGTTLPASFTFQTTNPATNAVTGTVNTPVDIPANPANPALAKQTFVFTFTPTAAIAPTDVRLNFVCANAAAAPIVSGLNTLLLSASTTPVPDIVAISATLKNDGIVNIPGTTGTGIFSVAAMNLGTDATLTVSVDMGAAILPVRLALCQTDPMTGQCVTPTVPTTSPVVTTINSNAIATFGIFATGTSTVSFAPELNRIFVRFTDAGGVPRGSTSVAVKTTP